MTTTIATPSDHSFWDAATAPGNSEEAKQVAETLESSNLEAQRVLWLSFEHYFTLVNKSNDAKAKKRADFFLKNNPKLARLCVSEARAARAARAIDPHYVSEMADPQALFTSGKVEQQGAYLSSHPEAFAQWQAREYKPGGPNYSSIVRRAARDRIKYLQFQRLGGPISGRNKPRLGFFARLVRAVKRAFGRFVSPKPDLVLKAQRLQIQVNAKDLRTAQEAKSQARAKYNTAVEAHNQASRERNTLQAQLAKLDQKSTINSPPTFEADSAEVDENANEALREATSAGDEENINPLNSREKTLSTRLLHMRSTTEAQTEALNRHAESVFAETAELTADIDLLTQRITTLQQQQKEAQAATYKAAVTAFQYQQEARRTAISKLMDAHAERRTAQTDCLTALRSKAATLKTLLARYPEHLAALLDLADADPDNAQKILATHTAQQKKLEQLQKQLQTLEIRIDGLSGPDQTLINIPQDAAASSNLRVLRFDTEDLKNEVARLNAEASRVRENTAALEKENTEVPSIQDPDIFSESTTKIKEKARKLREQADTQASLRAMDAIVQPLLQQPEAAEVAAENARVQMSIEDSRSTQAAARQDQLGSTTAVAEPHSKLDYTAYTEASKPPAPSASDRSGLPFTPSPRTRNEPHQSELPYTPTHISYTPQEGGSQLSYTLDAHKANRAASLHTPSTLFLDSNLSPGATTMTPTGYSTPAGQAPNFKMGETQPPSPIAPSVNRTATVDSSVSSPSRSSRCSPFLGRSPFLGCGSPLQPGRSQDASCSETPASGKTPNVVTRRSLLEALNNAAATPASGSKSNASGMEYTMQSTSLGAA